MPFLARVTCPACGTQFQTPVNQILDVRVNPDAKQMVLGGTVNVAQCPSCGTAGALNLPFLYHDPEQEVALLFLPMEAGRTEEDRQKLAGVLTRQLMDSLPPEERKGYLLQPETFITLDSLVRRVLELEGVSDEDLERSRKQQELLRSLVEADEEAWEALVAENTDLIDGDFFSMLNYNLQVLSSAGVEEGLAKVQALQDYLIEHHPMGRELKARSDVVRPFMEEPSRETLLQALVNAPDEETVEVLSQMGLSLMDYTFFQVLNKRIEKADEEEAARLKKLRRHILDIREDAQEASEELARERLKLLHRMIDSAEPMKMARSHLSELDRVFVYVLQSRMQYAQQVSDDDYLEQLEKISDILSSIMEESVPPQVALVRRLLMATSNEEVNTLLQQNRQMLDEDFVEFMKVLEDESREQGDVEVADRLSELRQKIQGFVSPLVKPGEAAPSPSAPRPGEREGPGGLIISTKK
ncbi:MAG: CpXC domain-containing protein [Anaerolineae bacterium]